MKNFYQALLADLAIRRLRRHLSGESVQRWKESSTLEQKSETY
jgi:hypothetical protein